MIRDNAANAYLPLPVVVREVLVQISGLGYCSGQSGHGLANILVEI